MTDLFPELAGDWRTKLKRFLLDLDARIDLQQALDHVYDVYGYQDFVYSGTPDPPLSPEEEEWATAILASQHLRD